MTLLNPTNPRIKAAQATVIETLAGIPDEYGAVFVIADYQDIQTGELPVAVREERKRVATEQAAQRLNVLWARKARKAGVRGVVVGLDGRRVAA